MGLFVYWVNSMSMHFQTTKHPDDDICLKIIDVDDTTIRIAFHLNISNEMTEKICKKLAFVLKEIDNVN